jgi:O-antigen ligase
MSELNNSAFNSSVLRRAQRLLLYVAISVTLIVTPQFNLDPINLPKFLLLVVFSGALIGYLKGEIFKIPTDLKIASISFVLSMLITFFLSGAPFLGQFYGDFGRNTGLLTYFSLVIIFLSAVVVNRSGFSEKIIIVMIGSGSLVVMYGLIQWADLDPVDWANPYNKILGTLGNPNFASAFFGFTVIACLAYIFDQNQSNTQRLPLALLALLALFLIIKSDATQGLMLTLLGVTLLFYLRFLKEKKNFVVTFTYICTFFICGFLAILGLLQRGPLGTLLYQESVTYRGDYWRAGWKMLWANPFTGVGMDNYGDWYRASRTLEATERRGPDVISNSAHNVFLDLASNGGFPLVLSYLMIVSLVARSAWKLVSRNSGYDKVASALVVIWIAYVLQSIISINQIGLALWGWLLGGTIIGYEKFGEVELARLKRKESTKDFRSIPPSYVLTSALSMLIAALLGLGPVIKDASYISAVKKGDFVAIENATMRFPHDGFYFNYSSRIALENDYSEKARQFSKSAIQQNARDFNAWKTLVDNPKISSSEKADAIKKMKELDPFNNTLGQ